MTQFTLVTLVPKYKNNLVCAKVLQFVKIFYVQHHYSVYHAKVCDKYEGEEQAEIIEWLIILISINHGSHVCTTFLLAH